MGCNRLLRTSSYPNSKTAFLPQNETAQEVRVPDEGWGGGPDAEGPKAQAGPPGPWEGRSPWAEVPL